MAKPIALYCVAVNATAVVEYAYVEPPIASVPQPEIARRAMILFDSEMGVQPD